MKTFLAIVGGVLFYLAALIGNAFLGGWVLSTMWGWFIVPIGFPVINYWLAMGITLVVEFFQIGLAKSSEQNKLEKMLKGEKSEASDIFGSFIGCAIWMLLILGISALVQLGI